MLCKPVSRVAFIVAKLLANSTGIVLTIILAQGLIAYLISTFMLGTIFEHTGPVIGISIAFLFAQNISMSFSPALAQYVPWTLAIPANGAANPSIAMNLMAGVAVPSFLPLYVALMPIVLFVVLASWIFQRQAF